jgi:hypothetical protein
MSYNIDRFLNQIREAESRQQREIVLTLMQARDLHSDITRLLLKLNDLNNSQNQSISVELKGNDF